MWTTLKGILAGIEGVECVMDDIICTAATDEEHLARLERVFARLDAQDIRLNKDKCVFFKNAVTYCGFRLKHGEIHKVEDKMREIKTVPSPRNVSELRAFLGLIQFYAGFASRLADLAHPLYTLLKSSAPFVWSDRMEKAFEAIKIELCSDRVLVPFDPSRPLLLATDASPVGISAVLSHRFPDESERPVAYYSRSLTETERRYSQIDKEALGIKTGVEKFFYYLFGRRFTLITDSRPLTQIFAPSKMLPPLSATRMQHYAIYLMGFNFDIVYRQSHKHGNADALSRLPARSEQLQVKDEIESFVIHQLEDTPLNFDVIANSTPNCRELRPLFEALKKHSQSRDLPRFHNVDLTEFSLHEGSVILRGHRIVVPSSCRKQVLAELHEGHFGEKKMKELSRRYVWRPNIDTDIKNKSLACLACLEHAKNPQKEVVHPWHPCSQAFERLHLDYAGSIQGHYILLIVDAYSKWLEDFATKDKTTSATLRHLRETVARFGVPKTIVTDNDPCFTSQQMKHFCKSNGIRSTNSPPFHPASNGQAERYVQTLKTALKKIASQGRDIHHNLSHFLFRQRLLANSSTGESPALRMIGRELRSKLDLLVETPKNETDTKPAAKFAVGEPVVVRDYRSARSKWIRGRVVKNSGSRVCQVKVPHGIWTRHYEQIRRRKEETATQGNAENETLFVAAVKAAVASTQAGVEGRLTPLQREQESTHEESDSEDYQSLNETTASRGEEETISNDSSSRKTKNRTVTVSPTPRRSNRPNIGIPPQRFE